MYYPFSFYYFIFNLFQQNQDAFISLPSSVKTILTITLALWLFTSLFHKAKKLITYGILATIIYFGATYFGII